MQNGAAFQQIRFICKIVLCSPTLGRGVGRRQQLRPIFPLCGQFGSLLQHPHQIAVWIQPILLCRLNQAEDHRAGLSGNYDDGDGNWNSRSVKYILTNRTYTGMLVQGKEKR